MLLLAKGLGLFLNLYCDITVDNCLTSYLQEASTQFQSQLADLKNRLELQEAETRKADSKFKFSLDETENLKTDFNTEKAVWAEEKAALIKRAEKAEASLEEVTTNFASLQHHINQMNFAIFGKIILYLNDLLPFVMNCLVTQS